jgi:hypothetical protein
MPEVGGFAREAFARDAATIYAQRRIDVLNVDWLLLRNAGADKWPAFRIFAAFSAA